MLANPLGHALHNRHAGHHTFVGARTDVQAPEIFTLTSPTSNTARPSPRSTVEDSSGEHFNPPRLDDGAS
jgi:hypothetical protein